MGLSKSANKRYIEYHWRQLGLQDADEDQDGRWYLLNDWYSFPAGMYIWDIMQIISIGHPKGIDWLQENVFDILY